MQRAATFIDVRALLGGVAAQQHDTSVREIEAHYVAYILDHSDALARTTQTVAPGCETG